MAETGQAAEGSGPWSTRVMLTKSIVHILSGTNVNAVGDLDSEGDTRDDCRGGGIRTPDLGADGATRYPGWLSTTLARYLAAPRALILLS